MERKLEQELIRETRLEDVPGQYRDIAELIGIDNLVKLAHLAQGDAIYIPKADTIYRRARDRRMLEEYTGYNITEIARRYDLSVEGAKRVLKKYDPQQISLFSDL